MRRRRRTRGTWFPNLGSFASENSSGSGRVFSITLGSADPETIITPLTYDVEFGEDADSEISTSLSDIVGSEYVLQRIVGSLFVYRIPAISAGVDVSPAILFTAGFFVARQNDSAVAPGIDSPVGSASAQERQDNYSPMDSDNIREPWIWRRSWILGAGLNQSNSGAGVPLPASTIDAGSFPCSNVYYGSLRDGPHIDSKVKRRVAQDNRLWLALTAKTWTFPSVPVPEVEVRGYVDYRLYGSLRRARQQSAF